MTIGEIIAMGAVAAAEAVRDAKAAIDADGTPLWSPEPSEADWESFEAATAGHELPEGAEGIFLEAYADVAVAAADAAMAWM